MATYKRVRSKRGEHYAHIPEQIMTSPAYVSLPHYARSTLFLLASKYRGNNNGDLSLTKHEALENGIGNWEWSSGLDLLQQVGLIEKTRQGKVVGGNGVCNLFRITWRDFNPSDKYDIPTLIDRPPSHEWARWKRPDDWEAIMRESKHKAQGKPLRRSTEDTAATIAQLRDGNNSPVLTGGPSQSTRVDRGRNDSVHTGGP